MLYIRIRTQSGLVGILLIVLITVLLGCGGSGGDGDDDDDGDSGIDTITWYEDSDGDGYGNPDSSLNSVSQPEDYVSNSADCDDTNQNRYPGATEICGDGIDQDCNGDDVSCGGFGTPDRHIVAIDAGGKIMSTTDGETWSPINNTSIANASHIAVLTSPLPQEGRAIQSSGSTMVATTLNDIYYSIDQGITWNHAKSPGQINDLLLFNNTFIIVGGGEGFIEYSEDGINWATVLSGGSRFQSVAYGLDKIIACGMGNRVVISEDNGRTWKNDNGGDGTQKRFNSILFGTNQYVGVGTALDGISSMWATSFDGETWENETTDTNYISMWDIAYGNGWYVTGGYNYILRSIDGITWQDGFSHDGEVRNINYHNERFIATGSNTSTGNAMVFISNDHGGSWTEIVIGGSDNGAIVDAAPELFEPEVLFVTNISGFVKDESDQPIEDALIILSDIDTGKIEVSFSDTNGEYDLFVDHDGDYLIACIADGFLAEERTVESESTTEELNFVLGEQ